MDKEPFENLNRTASGDSPACAVFGTPNLPGASSRAESGTHALPGNSSGASVNEQWLCPPDSSGTPGYFLRRFREQLRLTQQEMAAAAGVDRSLIAKIEGDRDVRFGTVSRLVEARGGRLVLGVRTPRPLKDMAEDHVPAREKAYLATEYGQSVLKSQRGQ